MRLSTLLTIWPPIMVIIMIMILLSSICLERHSAYAGFTNMLKKATASLTKSMHTQAELHPEDYPDHNQQQDGYHYLDDQIPQHQQQQEHHQQENDYHQQQHSQGQQFQQDESDSAIINNQRKQTRHISSSNPGSHDDEEGFERFRHLAQISFYFNTFENNYEDFSLMINEVTDALGAPCHLEYTHKAHPPLPGVLQQDELNLSINDINTKVANQKHHTNLSRRNPPTNNVYSIYTLLPTKISPDKSFAVDTWKKSQNSRKKDYYHNSHISLSTVEYQHVMSKYQQQCSPAYIQRVINDVNTRYNDKKIQITGYTNNFLLLTNHCVRRFDAETGEEQKHEQYDSLQERLVHEDSSKIKSKQKQQQQFVDFPIYGITSLLPTTSDHIDNNDYYNGYDKTTRFHTMTCLPHPELHPCSQSYECSKQSECLQHFNNDQNEFGLYCSAVYTFEKIYIQTRPLRIILGLISMVLLAGVFVVWKDKQNLINYDSPAFNDNFIIRLYVLFYNKIWLKMNVTTCLPSSTSSSDISSNNTAIYKGKKDYEDEKVSSSSTTTTTTTSSNLPLLSSPTTMLLPGPLSSSSSSGVGNQYDDDVQNDVLSSSSINDGNNTNNTNGGAGSNYNNSILGDLPSLINGTSSITGFLNAGLELLKASPAAANRSLLAMSNPMYNKTLSGHTGFYSSSANQNNNNNHNQQQQNSLDFFSQHNNNHNNNDISIDDNDRSLQNTSSFHKEDRLTQHLTSSLLSENSDSINAQEFARMNAAAAAAGGISPIREEILGDSSNHNDINNKKNNDKNNNNSSKLIMSPLNNSQHFSNQNVLFIENTNNGKSFNNMPPPNPMSTSNNSLSMERLDHLASRRSPIIQHRAFTPIMPSISGGPGGMMVMPPQPPQPTTNNIQLHQSSNQQQQQQNMNILLPQASPAFSARPLAASQHVGPNTITPKARQTGSAGFLPIQQQQPSSQQQQQ